MSSLKLRIDQFVVHVNLECASAYKHVLDVVSKHEDQKHEHPLVLEHFLDLFWESDLHIGAQGLPTNQKQDQHRLYHRANAGHGSFSLGSREFSPRHQQFGVSIFYELLQVQEISLVRS